MSVYVYMSGTKRYSVKNRTGKNRLRAFRQSKRKRTRIKNRTGGMRATSRKVKEKRKVEKRQILPKLA